MTTRSLMPSSLSLRRSRPSLGSRGSSQSSIRSAFSHSCPPSPSPNAAITIERNSYFTAAGSNSTDIGRTATTGAHHSYKSVNSPTGNANAFATIHTQSGQESPRIGRSRPIAIDISSGRRKSGPTDTPPEPLSARGESRTGGYFPFHEDGKRVYTPHLVYHQQEQEHSLQPSTSNKPQLSPGGPDGFFGTYTPHGHAISESIIPTQETFRRPSLRPAPSTSAFLPTMTVSQGKYHPSNYKNSGTTTAVTSAPGTQMSVPTFLPNTSNSAKDIRKKLQQYQRDMVEQAALAARLSVPGREPISPRLGPLGSPGPVTPWELDGENDGYLERGAGEEAVQTLIEREMTRVENTKSVTTVTTATTRS